MSAGLLIAVALIAASSFSLAAGSVCVKFPANQVNGSGPLPYNYRIIDGHIHAGGHPFNPANDFGNSDQAVLSILSYLKSKGVDQVVDLEDTKSIYHRYKSLLDQAGLKLLHVPMNAFKTPNREEWLRIREAMKSSVYIHCAWGADRTGIVIAKYLVEEKGYSTAEALRAVSTGGSHAGVLGGLKPIFHYGIFLHFLRDNFKDAIQN